MSELGPYKLLRRLGRGGMGEVWEAERDGQRVALKTVVAGTDDPATLRRLTAEAQLASLLVHPNIVRVLEHGAVDGKVYFTMEQLEGATLASLAGAGRPAPVGAVVRIAQSVLAALAYAQHALGPDGQPLRLIHRDLKPSNVFVTTGGTVKLIDFGLAQGDGVDVTRTRTGMLRGSLPYLSPEQVRGEPLDARADLFSLGLVLHELLTGRRVFAASNDAATLGAVMWTPIPSLVGQVPAPLAQALSWMLERELPQRAPSADAVLQLLTEQLDPELAFDAPGLAHWAASREPLQPEKDGTSSLVAPVEELMAAPTGLRATPPPPPPVRRRWLTPLLVATLALSGAYGVHRAFQSGVPVALEPQAVDALGQGGEALGTGAGDGTAPAGDSARARGEAALAAATDATQDKATAAPDDAVRTAATGFARGGAPAGGDESAHTGAMGGEAPAAGDESARAAAAGPARTAQPAPDSRGDSARAPQGSAGAASGTSNTSGSRATREAPSVASTKPSERVRRAAAPSSNLIKRRSRAAAGARAQGTALLTVESQPVWARVKVDGEDLGVTPIVREALTPGRRRLSAVRADGQRTEREVTLVPGKEERVLLIW